MQHAGDVPAKRRNYGRRRRRRETTSLGAGARQSRASTAPPAHATMPPSRARMAAGCAARLAVSYSARAVDFARLITKRPERYYMPHFGHYIDTTAIASRRHYHFGDSRGRG